MGIQNQGREVRAGAERQEVQKLHGWPSAQMEEGELAGRKGHFAG
jgi:hypothetical protein